LLNCLKKIIEKVAITIISKYCETLKCLHEGQFDSRKQRSAVDAVTIIIATVEEAWKQKKLAETLFLNIKEAFDYIIKKQLLKRIIELRIPRDITRWTDSFLKGRKIQLVINGYTYQERDIKTEVLQKSSVSLILFIIYLSEVFEAIKAKISIKTLSFADDIGLIATEGLIKEIIKTLKKAEKEAFQ
jgi:hypothetical protein